ncbi:MAG: hypothetical protein OHK006_25500 [Thermodesulfovibrionales bacterium]
MLPYLTALHVSIVVLWIGGVAFVTMIIFPMLLKMEESLEKVMMFQRVENAFARHARIYAWLTGLTGGVLLWLTGQHAALFTRDTAGVTVMIAVWIAYVLVLSFEKRLFGIIFSGRKELEPSRVFFRLSAFHWIVLGLSMAAVFLGVLAGHGGL